MAEPMIEVADNVMVLTVFRRPVDKAKLGTKSGPSRDQVVIRVGNCLVGKDNFGYYAGLWPK